MFFVELPAETVIMVRQPDSVKNRRSRGARAIAFRMNIIETSCEEDRIS
jgi:hypothetical protein